MKDERIQTKICLDFGVLLTLRGIISTPICSSGGVYGSNFVARALGWRKWGEDKTLGVMWLVGLVATSTGRKYFCLCRGVEIEGSLVSAFF